MSPRHDPELDALVRGLAASIVDDPVVPLPADPPQLEELVAVLELLRAALFPEVAAHVPRTSETISRFVSAALHEARDRLFTQLVAAFSCAPPEGTDPPKVRAEQAMIAFLPQIEAIRGMLVEDASAAYEGDPAARSVHEVLLCYPGFRAMLVHRIAHALHDIGVPFVPRMMAEWSHGATGIDIHPGAVIGKGFFIDHGTGVTIGETVSIGEHCKIYQGVTLGARSFQRDAGGRIRKGYKRHPTLEDRVTVYAGATILGGDTVIGRGSVISGGVFVMQSVPPDHLAAPPRVELRVREQRTGI